MQTTETRIKRPDMSCSYCLLKMKNQSPPGLANERKETFSFSLLLLQLFKIEGWRELPEVRLTEEGIPASTFLQASFNSNVWNKYQSTNQCWMQNAITLHCDLADYTGISQIHLKLKLQATVLLVQDELNTGPAPLTLQCCKGNGNSQSERSWRPMDNKSHSRDCNTVSQIIFQKRHLSS